ncbi:MAG: glycosyltransferase family protein [Syntrophobacteraceae bacterium]
MKIMLYCQHVLGIGHFFRSMRLAAAMDRHEVLFVEGGLPLEGFAPPPHVRRVFLPPLMMDAEFKTMDALGEDEEMVKERRKDLLMQFFRDFAPDVLLVELYPFGRKKFAFELLPILDAIRKGDAPAKVVCSLRDILVEKEDQAAYEEKVIKTLNACFHLLLVHSDGELIRLDETFSRVADIRIPVRYTGYVLQAAPRPIRKDHGKEIVASSGGGRVGVGLLESVIRAVKMFDDPAVRLRIFIGPFMEEKDRDGLARIVSGDARIALCPFAADFAETLAGADLSISMAGYNTCMDILASGVRALVHPFPQNREQAMRAARFAERGVLNVLEDLRPETVLRGIREELDGPRCATREEPNINISGAENTVAEIQGAFPEMH